MELAEMITETARIQEAHVVVELGTGTGVFTKAILRKLPSNGRFLGVELDRVFAALTRSRCPGARILRGNAAHLRSHLEAEGLDGCDAIVSGLPWAAFPDSLQECLLDAVVDALYPGGRFATFAYLQGLLLPAGRRFRTKLESRFAEIGTTSIVWRNLPPAFVYWGDKAG
jgi:phosphatidylethanolamine/phosphatidyl-N-methylethanolamine N-methyltransferase